MQQHKYGFGVLLAIVGGVFLSTNGIMLRSVEHADGWQILFYRAIAFSITMFLVLLLRYRGETVNAFRAIGRRGVWAGLALGIASCCYVFAILHTTVANAIFIIGAGPLATAFFAWLVLGERTSAIGIAAMLVSLCGIGLLIADGLIDGRWFGNVMALCVVAASVIYLLIVRASRETDMLPATCIAGVTILLVGFVGADSLSIETHDLIIVLVMGSVQLTVGFMCYTIAARYILAAEVSLFALTESILAPIWVWIGVGETPSDLTIVGSAIVLLSVAVYGMVEIMKARRNID